MSGDFQTNPTDISWQKVAFFSLSKLCTIYCSYLGRPLEHKANLIIAQYFTLIFFETPHESKSYVCQWVRLLLAPGSTSYNISAVPSKITPIEQYTIDFEFSPIWGRFFHVFRGKKKIIFSQIDNMQLFRADAIKFSKFFFFFRARKHEETVLKSCS